MRVLRVTAVLIFLADQLSKLAVVEGMDLRMRGEIDVLPPFLNFRMAWNEGINFGLFAGHPEIMRWAITFMAVAISAWVALWMRKGRQRPIAHIAAGLLVGGALANALDRVRYGAVADFLNMSCCGIENPFAFNIADIGVFAGAFGLIVFTGSAKTA